MIPIWPWKGLTLDMVQPPGVPLPNFDKKIHPSWESAHGTQQFVLPSGHSIAFWNNIPPTLFFYNRGYFRRNKRIPSEFKFCFDPDFDPFPDFKPGIIKYEPPLFFWFVRFRVLIQLFVVLSNFSTCSAIYKFT